MQISLDPAIFFGLVITTMLAVISFFLRSLMQEFRKLQEDVKKQGDEIHQMRVDLAKIEGRVLVAEQWIEKYNEDRPAFYKEFPRMVKEAVADAFEGIDRRISAIEAEKKK